MKNEQTVVNVRVMNNDLYVSETTRRPGHTTSDNYPVEH